MKRFILLFISIHLSGCVSTAPELESVALPPARIWLQNYSLVPLDETGWYVAHKSAVEVVLGKYVESEDGTYIVQSNILLLPTFNNDDEFLDFVVKSQKDDTDSQRFKELNQDLKLTYTSGSRCVESHISSEDYSATKRTSRPDPMVLEMKSMVCEHARLTNFGIQVSISHRYYPESRDAEFESKAKKLFDSVLID